MTLDNNSINNRTTPSIDETNFLHIESHEY